MNKKILLLLLFLILNNKNNSNNNKEPIEIFLLDSNYNNDYVSRIAKAMEQNKEEWSKTKQGKYDYILKKEFLKLFDLNPIQKQMFNISQGMYDYELSKKLYALEFWLEERERDNLPSSLTNNKYITLKEEEKKAIKTDKPSLKIHSKQDIENKYTLYKELKCELESREALWRYIYNERCKHDKQINELGNEINDRAAVWKYIRSLKKLR